MSTTVSVFSGAGLPAVQSLTAALRSVITDSPTTGQILVKMDKFGSWVYGSDNVEIEDDSTWAVNPFSFVHGYIAWGEAEVLGEKMVPITTPLPEVDSPPVGADRGWQTQVGFSVKCLSGEDAGMEGRYTATSTGGKRAIQALAIAIAKQVDADPTKPVAVVRLRKDHYMHKIYGKVFVPVFNMVSWMGMDGEAPAAPAAAEPEAAPAPAGRRRRNV
jgi:hypothetical protein